MNWSHYISCAMCGTVRKAVTAASIIFLLMSAAWGQEQKCFPAEQLLSGLKERYHEAIVGVGASESGNIIVITASENGETWSVIMMSPQGVACPQASGTNWRVSSKGKPS